MENKIVFGVREGICLLVTMVCAKAFLGFPTAMLEDSRTAAWMEVVLISLMTLALFLLIYRLQRKFEGMDLVDLGEYAGGSFLRIVSGLVVAGSLFYITSMILREFSENMKTIALQNTPISMVSLFFIAGIVVGSYLGVEAVVRFNTIVVPIIAVGAAIILLGAARFMEATNLIPVLGSGPAIVLQKSLLRLAVYFELILVFSIAPFLRTGKNLKKAGVTAIILSAVFLTLTTLIYQSVFSYPAALDFFLPVYQLARLINYGRFFQRVESIFILIWAATALQYLTLGFLFFLLTLQKAFGLKYYRPLILPGVVLLFTVSLLPASLMSTLAVVVPIFRQFSSIITFGLPLLLVGLALLKRCKVKGSSLGK